MTPVIFITGVFLLRYDQAVFRRPGNLAVNEVQLEAGDEFL